VGVRVEVEYESNFGSLADDIGRRLVEGENLAAERLQTLAVDLSPWDIGTLADSAAVENATTPEEGSAVTFDTPYAARLHEHPEYNFSTDANPNAQGKYLESAAVENKDELGAIIGKQVTGA
jgi:hypothetical protein